MFSLQKFFGRDPKFFALIETLAAEAENAASALTALLPKPVMTNGAFERLRAARKESKRAHEELGELLVRTFVTALEKEDLESLSNALYKIPKPIEKFAERLVAANGLVAGFDFSKQDHIIRKATSAVSSLARLLKQGIDLEKARVLNSELHELESEADETELVLLRELYQKYEADPVKILIVRDLYDLLERVIDRCRDAGNNVMHIVLKNS